MPVLIDTESRTWTLVAWCELWRSEPGLESTMQEARAHERALLAEQPDHALTREELDGLVALLDGLLVAVCRPVRPMSPEHARQHLRRAYPDLGSPG